jgi:murein DD-endopeptidase MepM/ murein hydrolase activator NlpD
MKNILAILACLLFVNVCHAQDGFFQRIRNRFVEHDTVYIFVNAMEFDSIGEDSKGEDADLSDDNEDDDNDEENNEQSGGIAIPIDTLDTHDMFRKVVLFDNGTWLYYNIDMSFIPYAIESDHWITEKVHSYNDIALNDLPDSVELTLVDSLHRFCIPHPGIVTSRYKYRGRRPHKGIDLGLHTGDAIYAAFDGVVRTALPANLTGGYGNALVIRHPNGLETYYGHLSHFIVKSGDIVKAGELIGYGGSTGRSTGPHLHFEIRYMGQAFDPERIFDFESGTLRSEVFTLRKHYFNINSHYGMTDQQSKTASTKAPKSSSGSGGGAVYYKVKKGDTLSKIASRNGTTVKKICQLNGIKQNTVLKVGRRLRVK